MALFSELVLHTTSEFFIIEARDVNPRQLLFIHRINHQIALQSRKDFILPSEASSQSICGVLGIIPLISGPYLIVVTKKILLGEISGQQVWGVQSTQVIPFARSLLHLTEEQIAYNATYVSLVESVLSTPTFIFSYNLDITHTLQRLHKKGPEFFTQSLFERADPRFVWNGRILQPISAIREAKGFCLPVLLGFISINCCTLNGITFSWTIIARRSLERPGMRLFTRGVDEEGHVANFVEIEQLVQYNEDRASFIQTRGSIPLYWDQDPNLRLKPKPTLQANRDHADAFIKHFSNQVALYGRQVAVNLIDQERSEGELEKAFHSYITLTQLPAVRYEAFDFHQECSHMKWDRLHILIERLIPDLQDMGYFLIRDGVALLQQGGAFRTNCIDCLDRTNVVQSMIANRNLEAVLLQFGILHNTEHISDHPTFEFMFKNRWADMGDQISIQYAGTGALKSDFTRTGKRTNIGLLSDGVNALERYVRNNFSDGSRQDALNLFLGHYHVRETEGVSTACPFSVQRPWFFFIIPALLVAASALGVTSVLLYRPFHHALLLLIICTTIAFAAAYYMFSHGREFVDYPKLPCRKEQKTP